MGGLDPELIANLLKEEAEKPSGRGGGGRTKVDPTAQRDLPTWWKLPHHICASFCVHRTEGENPTIPRNEDGSIPEGAFGHSCWNPDCQDHTRNKETDRGTQIVAEVKGQFICRYCYLAGYLSDG